jgi:hypothetical protein
MATCGISAQLSFLKVIVRVRHQHFGVVHEPIDDGFDVGPVITDENNHRAIDTCDVVERSRPRVPPGSCIAPISCKAGVSKTCLVPSKTNSSPTCASTRRPIAIARRHVGAEHASEGYRARFDAGRFELAGWYRLQLQAASP